MLVDLLTAAATADCAAPVEPTAAFLHDPFPTRHVTSPATHHLARVCAVSGAVAPAPGSARRSRPLVGIAEVRRRLDVDEFRRTGTTAGGDCRLHLSTVKQQKARRAFKPFTRTASMYQRHLSYAQNNNINRVNT